MTAPGLAEFVKFLPQIRLGQLQVERLFLLLPLFTAMLALPLFVENRRLNLPAWLRYPLRLAVLPLALAGLSPVWSPDVLLAAEFRLQTLLALVALGLAVLAPLLRALPLRLLAGLLLAAGLASLLLPVWQFSLVQPGLVEAYHQPVSLGWGWWLTAAGLTLSMAGALGAALAKG